MKRKIFSNYVAFSENLNFTVHRQKTMVIKFIYSEKATNFWEISTVDLSYVVTVKSKVEILQNSVAFSEYMNFNHFARVFQLIKTELCWSKKGNEWL